MRPACRRAPAVGSDRYGAGLFLGAQSGPLAFARPVKTVTEACGKAVTETGVMWRVTLCSTLRPSPRRPLLSWPRLGAELLVHPEESAGLAGPEAGIEAVVPQQFRMACPLRRCAPGRARSAGRAPRWSRGGGRWRSPSCRPSGCRAGSWIAASTSESRAEVASSRTRIGASFRITRAIAMRWRWPPESLTPRSPTCGVVAAAALGVGQLGDEAVGLGQRGGAADLASVASGRP